MFTFCSNYVIYLSTRPLQEFCCQNSVSSCRAKCLRKATFSVYSVIGQCFQICEEVPLEMYRMFPILTHTEICVASHEFSEMWSKVSFPFPDEGTAVLSMGGTWGCSRAGIAWLGVFYWFMKDKQLLHLICCPASEIHLMTCALELTNTNAL